jgi:hypothetical protein
VLTQEVPSGQFVLNTARVLCQALLCCAGLVVAGSGDGRTCCMLCVCVFFIWCVCYILMFCSDSLDPDTPCECRCCFSLWCICDAHCSDMQIQVKGWARSDTVGEVGGLARGPGWQGDQGWLAGMGQERGLAGRGGGEDCSLVGSSEPQQAGFCRLLICGGRSVACCPGVFVFICVVHFAEGA